MRVDLHIHTHCSPDACISPKSLLHWARRRGLDAVAITDHNSMAALPQLALDDALCVIPGEEILTEEGEVIGLFLESPLPAGLPLQETVEAIHAQGGLVSVPHPLDRFRSSALGLEALQRIHGSIDLIEGCNARALLQADNDRACAFAKHHGLAIGAGSDAHLPCEIGRAYLDMPDFSDRDSFLQGLSRSQIGGRISSPFVHLGSSLVRWSRRLTQD